MSRNKIVKKAFLLLTTILLSKILLSQSQVTIAGYLKGLGTGKKVYLGNKPNGIRPTFVEIFYDSTYSINDSFYFKKQKFDFVSDYSIETELKNGWSTFLVDKGNIFITGYFDTIYRSKIIGSHNENLYRDFYKKIYKPWDTQFFSLMKKLPKGKEVDTAYSKKINDSIITLNNNYRKQIFSFYKQNVKSSPYVAFRVLRMATLENLSDNEVTKYFKMLPTKVQNSPPLDDIKYRLFSYKTNVSIGKKLPNFSFFTPQLTQLKLNDISGKYRLLVFWASWCGPCIAEIPELDSLEKMYSSIGLKIYPINIDNENSVWENSLSKYTFNCTHLSQLTGNKSPIFKYFAFSSIPTAILLDNDNKILLYGADIKKYFDLIEKLSSQNK